MFFGSFQYALDDKGRLVIPAKLRGECGSTLFAMRGFENCLSLYPQAQFEKLVEKVSRFDYLQPEARPFMRLALASVIELPIDNHGRIQIPVETLTTYQFNKHLYIIGVQDHLEIWDVKTWEAYEAKQAAYFDSSAPKGQP